MWWLVGMGLVVLAVLFLKFGRYWGSWLCFRARQARFEALSAQLTQELIPEAQALLKKASAVKAGLLKTVGLPQGWLPFAALDSAAADVVPLIERINCRLEDVGRLELLQDYAAHLKATMSSLSNAIKTLEDSELPTKISWRRCLDAMTKMKSFVDGSDYHAVGEVWLGLWDSTCSDLSDLQSIFRSNAYKKAQLAYGPRDLYAQFCQRLASFQGLDGDEPESAIGEIDMACKFLSTMQAELCLAQGYPTTDNAVYESLIEASVTMLECGYADQALACAKQAVKAIKERSKVVGYHLSVASHIRTLPVLLENADGSDIPSENSTQQ